MDKGPSINYIDLRISELPPVFLNIPEVIDGFTTTSIILSDLLYEIFGKPMERSEINGSFTSIKSDLNYLKIIQIICYILNDKWFRDYFKSNMNKIDALKHFLFTDLAEYSKINKAERFVYDGEGREELSRLLFKSLTLIPEGETEAEAKDRLASIDSIERKRVIELSKQSQKRVKELQEALTRKEAEEAASKMTRE
ncbi:MAG TPA: hypothetical protein PK385_10100 [Spirochaetota bacterium]|nr:hypothetical protein [Spirochaetota bacterium]HOS33106.1 hypothetical protein [Spirochaetota bacterium]HOS56397.1 hypothetical protein [Spirochaetota bacterium]HPK62000.1 hypothetical protein [Spirochaetota bacterium]HQF77065.1 hypothetical protein [Spirochaetota bacterium]